MPESVIASFFVLHYALMRELWARHARTAVLRATARRLWRSVSR